MVKATATAAVADTAEIDTGETDSATDMVEIGTAEEIDMVEEIGTGKEIGTAETAMEVDAVVISTHSVAPVLAQEHVPVQAQFQVQLEVQVQAQVRVHLRVGKDTSTVRDTGTEYAINFPPPPFFFLQCNVERCVRYGRDREREGGEGSGEGRASERRPEVRLPHRNSAPSYFYCYCCC